MNGRERVLSGRFRRNQRALHWDYRSIGTYFVTVVAHDRVPLFGEVVDGACRVSPFGAAVADEWGATAAKRRNVSLDEFVVMPNHFHALLRIDTELPREPEGLAPTGNEPGLRIDSMANSLSAIVRGFKAASARRINELRQTPGDPVWQSSFHDSIVRDQRHLIAVRQYIRNNPRDWPTDPLFGSGTHRPDAIRP